MIEVILKFKDGQLIKVELVDYVAISWRDDKKMIGNLRRQGAEIVSFRVIEGE